ncbi:MAG: NUDIX hydrolase [Anaerolineales bacterium]|nr:NUDIX hydrolase [Anaerolineales bacterium]MCB0011590.1 NUDIX hydrolase [Anaerolineales bacterium]MCB0028896.1 NUDIX hydrolase [Anaerolineales bacterium]MCB8961839.1 NUDIX hydrolase [Ardenticatenales bacterium]
MKQLLDLKREINFGNIDELQRWLHRQGINTMRWGQHHALTVQHLWAEILRGETIILTNPPLRVVQVAQIIVRRGDQILIEAEQELKRGGRRRRQRPPAEKMKPGETVSEASLRCLHEELGVSPDQVKLFHDTYERQFHDGTAQSYPGLPTRWLLHRIEAEVTGLPTGSFCTAECTSNGHDPIERHFWEWQPETMLEKA